MRELVLMLYQLKRALDGFDSIVSITFDRGHFGCARNHRRVIKNSTWFPIPQSDRSDSE